MLISLNQIEGSLNKMELFMRPVLEIRLSLISKVTPTAKVFVVKAVEDGGTNENLVRQLCDKVVSVDTLELINVTSRDVNNLLEAISAMVKHQISDTAWETVLSKFHIKASYDMEDV
jgi:hypothetical protein